jgi:hypothetical protein
VLVEGVTEKRDSVPEVDETFIEVDEGDVESIEQGTLAIPSSAANDEKSVPPPPLQAFKRDKVASHPIALKPCEKPWISFVIGRLFLPINRSELPFG